MVLYYVMVGDHIVRNFPMVFGDGDLFAYNYTCAESLARSTNENYTLLDIFYRGTNGFLKLTYQSVANLRRSLGLTIGIGDTRQRAAKRERQPTPQRQMATCSDS